MSDFKHFSAFVCLVCFLSEATIRGSSRRRENDVKDIYLRYYGKTFDDFVELPLSRSVELLQLPSYRHDQITVLYIHGYLENSQKESVKTVVTAYLDAQPKNNIILLDWSNMAFGPYVFNAAPNTQKVGESMATELKRWFDEYKINPQNIHIVGHSLGGQTAGAIGHKMIKLGVTLPRITALDPAFPEFYPSILIRHITDSDAKLVDILHTDAGVNGAPMATGTVDFWPNGGSAFQPGCPKTFAPPLSDDALCSHRVSWRLWAASVRNPEGFPSAPKGLFGGFKDSTFKERLNHIVYLGVACNSNATGSYYLTTKSESPFSKGLDGLK